MRRYNVNCYQLIIVTQGNHLDHTMPQCQSEDYRQGISFHFEAICRCKTHGSHACIAESQCNLQLQSSQSILHRKQDFHCQQYPLFFLGFDQFAPAGSLLRLSHSSLLAPSVAHMSQCLRLDVQRSSYSPRVPVQASFVLGFRLLSSFLSYAFHTSQPWPFLPLRVAEQVRMNKHPRQIQVPSLIVTPNASPLPFQVSSRGVSAYFLSAEYERSERQHWVELTAVSASGSALPICIAPSP